MAMGRTRGERNWQRENAGTDEVVAPEASGGNDSTPVAVGEEGQGPLNLTQAAEYQE
jgi:hypothetical protein